YLGLRRLLRILFEDAAAHVPVGVHHCTAIAACRDSPGEISGGLAFAPSPAGRARAVHPARRSGSASPPDWRRLSRAARADDSGDRTRFLRSSRADPLEYRAAHGGFRT